jgi:hypothetical protein
MNQPAKDGETWQYGPFDGEYGRWIFRHDPSSPYAIHGTVGFHIGGVYGDEESQRRAFEYLQSCDAVLAAANQKAAEYEAKAKLLDDCITSGAIAPSSDAYEAYDALQQRPVDQEVCPLCGMDNLPHKTVIRNGQETCAPAGQGHHQEQGKDWIIIDEATEISPEDWAVMSKYIKGKLMQRPVDQEEGKGNE